MTVLEGYGEDRDAFYVRLPAELAIRFVEDNDQGDDPEFADSATYVAMHVARCMKSPPQPPQPLPRPDRSSPVQIPTFVDDGLSKTVDVAEAAEILGLGRSSLFEAFRHQGFIAAGPCRLYPIRMGQRVRVGRKAIDVFCAAIANLDDPAPIKISDVVA